MASPPLILEAMPPLAARCRAAQFALRSVLKCREEPRRMSPLGPTRTSLRTFDSVPRRRGLLGLGRELDLAAQFQSLCVEN